MVFQPVSVKIAAARRRQLAVTSGSAMACAWHNVTEREAARWRACPLLADGPISRKTADGSLPVRRADAGQIRLDDRKPASPMDLHSRQRHPHGRHDQRPDAHEERNLLLPGRFNRGAGRKGDGVQILAASARSRAAAAHGTSR